MNKDIVDQIRKRLAEHIRDTPKEVLYVELVSAGMKRDRKFEEVCNINIPTETENTKEEEERLKDNE